MYGTLLEARAAVKNFRHQGMRISRRQVGDVSSDTVGYP